MSKNPGMKPLRIEVSYTTRDYCSLSQYFNDLTKIGLLGDEEEIVLCKRIREPISGTRTRLVRIITEQCRQ